MIDIFKTVRNLYDYKFLLIFLALYLSIIFFDYHFIPDFFNFRLIKEPENLLLTLISLTVGTSSIILTIVLLVYGSLTKEVKRNSISFIISNAWIKILFSFFLSCFVFLGIVWASYNNVSSDDQITLLYSACLITIAFLTFQFPLIFLALKHNNSLDRVNDLIDSIDKDDLSHLRQPPINEFGILDFEVLEKNRVIILKDIGLNALKERDWSLPHYLLSQYFIKILENGKAEGLQNCEDKIYGMVFLCNHLKDGAIELGDVINVRATVFYLFLTHHKILGKRKDLLRGNDIDSSLLDGIRKIFKSERLYIVHSNIIEMLTKLINNHIERINYLDEELPMPPSSVNPDLEDVTVPHEIINHWRYMNNSLPELLKSAIEWIFESDNKDAIQILNRNSGDILEKIVSAKNLTIFQRIELFKSFFRSLRIFSDLALKNNVFSFVHIISPSLVVDWIKLVDKSEINSVDKAYSSFIPLNYFISLLEILNRKNELDRFYIDQLYLIGRTITSSPISRSAKIKVIKRIVDSSLEIYQMEKTKLYVRDEIEHQFNWLKKYLDYDKDLFSLKPFFSEIDEILLLSKSHPE